MGVADQIINGTYGKKKKDEEYSLEQNNTADSIIGGTYKPIETKQTEIKQVEQTVQQPEVKQEQPKEQKVDENKKFSFSIDQPYGTTPEQQANKEQRLREERASAGGVTGFSSGRQGKYLTDSNEFKKTHQSYFDDGYDFGDITRTLIDGGKNIGVGILSGIEGAGNSLNRAFRDLFGKEQANNTKIQNMDVSSYNRLVENGTPEEKQYYLNQLEEDYKNNNVEEKMYKMYKNALTTEDTRSDTVKTINDILGGADYQQTQTYKDAVSGNLDDTNQFLFGIGSSIGNMLPSMATSALISPAAGSAMFFTQAQQNYTEEAKQRGYSDGEARLYGLIMGGVETVVERLGFDELGGLGKMSADSLVKAASGEAMEEFVTPYIDSTVRMAFGEDFDLKSTTKDALEGATMAAITAAVMNGGSKGIAKVDNVINKANKGQQITTEELVDAAKELQKKDPDYINRYVTESTKGIVESQENVEKPQEQPIQTQQQVEQPQIPTQTPLNTLNQGVLQENNQTPYQTQTPQITPLNQVNQELQQVRQNDIANQVQAMNLEQEPEFTQKQGNYVYEKSDNSKIDNLRKDAATYLKEGEQTTNFVNTLEKLVKDKDIEIRFDPKLGNNVNGTYKDGVITINPNSNRAGEFVAIHELTHAIGTKPMIDMIQTYRKSNAEFNNAVERLLSTYNTTEINEEALGDIAGQLFGNQEYINNLSMENPSLFKKIYNEIKYLWHQFRGYKNQNQFIEDLRNKWESAYRNQKVQQKAKNSNIEMSNQTDSNGNMLSNEQVHYFKDSKVRDENGNLIIMNHATPDASFTVFKDEKQGKNSSKYYNQKGELGRGFYFSDLKSSYNIWNDWVERETQKPAQSMKVYLDIKNPFYVTNNKINQDVKKYLKEKGFIASKITSNAKALNSAKFDNIDIQDMLKTLGYDGIIDGDENTIYQAVVFNSNQIKNIDNLTPTTDKDIRYSKDNQTWREYLEKEFPSQGTRTNLQDINERNKPKQENKTTQEEKPQEMPKKEVKQEVKKEEVKKSFLTNKEQQELDSLKEIDNMGLADESDLKRIEELEKKSQGYTKKFPELKKTVTQEETKPLYFKYKDNQISRENNKILNQAKKLVESNTQGRRTKQQWLQVAEYIGSNADIKSSQDLQQLAMETWLASKPNTKDNLNRQGNKYVNFKTNEWFNAMYKGAGVGTDVKLSLEEATDNKGKKVDLKPIGNNTYEQVNVKPKKNEIVPDMSNKVLNIGDEKVSNFYSNITEKSKFITEENRESLKDNANLKYYDAITNKETLENAMDKLNKNAEQQVGEFFTKKDFTAEDVATGWILVKRYQDAGNYEAMSNVIEKMREQGTKAGQTVQAYGILQRLTPEGMEYYSQKQLDKAFNEFSKNKSKKQIERYANDFTLTAEEHQFIKDTMEKVETLDNDDAKKVEIAKIVSMLSDKIPPEKGQRLKSWMRISMLGNPKTQVRNVMGNAIIQPVNWVGDVFSAAADKIMSKKTGQRTIGTTSFKALRKGRNQGFKEAIRDAKTGVDTRDINLNRFEENIGSKPFYEGHNSKVLNKGAKVLNKTNKILSNIMSGGDRIFYQAIYENSLQNQMKLNKTNTPTQEMMEIAEQEALSRTWNDNNAYTKAVLQIRNAMNKINFKGYGLGDVLVPFAKTPANLTKAIVDYSPVGLVRTIVQDGRNYKNSLENGQYNAQLQHKFADSLGKGFAGSLLYMTAFALAKAGIITGKSDDDKDVANFLRNTLGIQPYSVKIGDMSFTYDWAQPLAAPFSIAADITQAMEKGDGDILSLLSSGANSGLNILLDQSFLSSIQDVFNSYNGPGEAIEKQISGLPARATPTLFKQIADLLDSTSRQTYLKDDKVGTVKNQVQQKIPIASQDLVANRDTLGREIEKYGGNDNPLEYAFNVFLNPANTNKGKPSKAAAEIYEVYKATGDKKIMPRQVGYSESVGGKTKNLTAEERSEWQRLSGEMVEENVKALTNSSEYKQLSSEDKAEVISGIVNFSFNKAKSELFDVPIATTYSAANKQVEKGVPLYDYYIKKATKTK